MGLLSSVAKAFIEPLPLATLAFCFFLLVIFAFWEFRQSRRSRGLNGTLERIAAALEGGSAAEKTAVRDYADNGDLGVHQSLLSLGAALGLHQAADRSWQRHGPVRFPQQQAPWQEPLLPPQQRLGGLGVVPQQGAPRNPQPPPPAPPAGGLQYPAGDDHEDGPGSTDGELAITSQLIQSHQAVKELGFLGKRANLPLPLIPGLTLAGPEDVEAIAADPMKSKILWKRFTDLIAEWTGERPALWLPYPDFPEWTYYQYLRSWDIIEHDFAFHPDIEEQFCGLREDPAYIAWWESQSH